MNKHTATKLQNTSEPAGKQFSLAPASMDSRAKSVKPCNLVLVTKPRNERMGDFLKIAEIIRQKAPDIKTKVVWDRPYNSLRPDLLWRPTLVVSGLQMKKFKPLRGSVAENRVLCKSEECRALEAIGVPVPRWSLLTEQEPQPNLDEFDDYVVTKPDFGGKGADVKIKRKTRARWKPPTNLRAIKANKTDVMAQKFIYTGKWPVSYRVTTLFGRVLFAWKVTACSTRRPLMGPGEFRGGADGGGLSICSSGYGCKFELTDDPDILQLASDAHAAFPDCPLLGFDILREVPGGKLFVIEANSCGQVWHFSSETGQSIQRDNQIDFTTQFNGLERAAEALIEETRLRAA